MIDKNGPLPREIIWILNQALNAVEAAHLLALYRRWGIAAAVRKGLWLNKNRSPIGRENWQKYNSPRQRAKRTRRELRKQMQRAEADEILQQAINAAKKEDRFPVLSPMIFSG